MAQLCVLPKISMSPIFDLVDNFDIDRLIGKNLKRLRELKGYSQPLLAETMGTTPQRLSAYETGRDGMGKDIMMRACKALNVQPWEFYVTEETPIVRDEKERETLYAIREAERLHVAEDIARYGRFLIEEAKRQAAGSVDERLARGREILKNRRRKKKTA